MKRLSRLFFFLLLPMVTYGQYQISGSVFDPGGSALSGVNVKIIGHTDDKALTSATNSSGMFTFDTTPGDYVLTVSHHGFKTQQFNCNVSGNLPLGILVLEEETIGLKEVIINQKKAILEQKIDRYVFNVAQSISAMGNDGLQVIRKTPGLQVSDNTINLVGKGKVRMMVNDRLLVLTGEDLMNYLQTVRSEDILSIEVITNPPSKYDAQGNSGLINIQLKKNNKEDFSGNVSTSYSQASYSSANLGTGINYKKKKISLSGTLSAGTGSVKETVAEKIFYPNNFRTSEETTRAYNKFFGGRLTVDYELNDKASIGLQYSGNKSAPDARDHIGVTYFNPETAVLNGSQFTKGATESTVNYNNLGAYYAIKLDTLGKKLSIGSDYFAYHSSRERSFNSLGENYSTEGIPVETARTEADNWGKQDIKIFTGNVDAELPYSWAKLEIGGKGSFINNQNNIGFRNLSADTLQSDRFRYKENIYALYATAYKKFGKWEFKAGLRFETTATEGISISLGQSNKKYYQSLFPSAFISYSINDNQNIALNYNRRINRPSYEALNPFRWYLNLSSYRSGNPFLKPESIDNIEITHTYKSTWISKLYASKTSNWYERVTYVSPENAMQAYVYENYATFYTVGISENHSFRVSEIWESDNQLSAYYNYSNIRLKVLQGETKGFSAFASTNNSFTLNASKTIFAELNYWYQFPASITQYSLSNFHQLDIGFKCSLFNKKLQLGINGSDILRTNTPRIVGYTNNIRQEYRNYNDLRRLVISLTYKFGGGKVKANEKSGGNEAETGRAL